ncbi:nuclear distribution protein NudE [Aspergillus clavatus NRRL 1]|uniref:Nuclear distribution protein NudE n=1 Tax=Aspergillus clavatus (strain ATCC 1007 / CBS 513.65 / DSM 816 / NCTC 3887 / NRRL 1 / QM 1276 / 107) TaxID=344612 RepID=A1CST4_ASPCL|nr:nuclear distribution protein NudE [Aspergillus clavatus NRRL 1]EAW06371.1 nuclear distribution protein NudE [Aspergillus clavatus NRRL 1]
MPSADDSSSTRPNGTSSRSDQLAWYKTQYEQLEAELTDFQASSRELEAELEKDIEASEKRERLLKEKVDSLKYEVEEWKTKYKQSKSEGNLAQNTLQKEITTLRDANRTLQLKLRDIEVANDDYEQQARHTTSSLEDLESKYNVAIERGVLLEEEIKNGEQEREQLRIENQRLRDELSDLKIETEIIHEKLRNTELQNSRRRKPLSLYRSPSTPQTPDIFDRSPSASIVSSPLFSTPTLKTSLMSATAAPPSPPISESSSSLRKSMNAMPGFPLQKASGPDSSFGSRSLHGSRTQRHTNTHTRATSYAFTSNRPTPSATSRPALPKPKPKPNDNKPNNKSQSSGLPKSGSLYQIRGLIGKMQKLEERVQSAKSKLPPPSDSPSRTSSRSGSIIGESPVASTITARRNSRKRLSGSSFSSSLRDGESAPSYTAPSRPSFSTRTQGDSRPSSRTSYSSRSSVSQSTHPSMTPSTRPDSRQSRTKTPLGHYSMNPTTESRRPRSSLSNPSTQNGGVNGMANIDEDEDLAMHMSLRAKISEIRESRLPAISTPVPNGLKKRTPSGMSGIPAPRSLRTSNGVDRWEGDMGPPEPKVKYTDLGETF